MTASAEQSERKQIGKRLQEARKLAGLSQAQVAGLLNIPRPSVSEFESGNRRVSADELKLLCETYEVNLHWALGQEEEHLSPGDDRLRLAARELAKLQPEEIEKLLRLFAALKTDPKAGS